MIPMELNPSKPSLIIGHNVAFDRTYIKEQYQLEVIKIKLNLKKKIFFVIRVQQCVFLIQ
jgi:DNA polymerase III epsilon subunit-like protein